MRQTFEDYLKEQWNKQEHNFPEDLLQERYDNWEAMLDVQEIKDYAESYGEEQYEAGVIQAKS